MALARFLAHKVEQQLVNATFLEQQQPPPPLHRGIIGHQADSSTDPISPVKIMEGQAPQRQRTHKYTFIYIGVCVRLCV